MAFSYVSCDRDQVFLLPPDLREWLPPEHLVHFVLEVVDAIDTSSLHLRHPNDRQGRPAYDPDMLLALTLYCACQRVESSRRVEQLCEVDVACRYVCANLTPDHATIARFLKDNQDAFALIFAETLRLCAEAGMVKVGMVALDGTKIAANASLAANATRDTIEAEAAAITAAIVAADEAEDAVFGDARGDELPEQLADRHRRRDRLARLRRCLDQLAHAEASQTNDAQRRARRRAEAAQGRKPPGRRPRLGSAEAVEWAEDDLVAARTKAAKRRQRRQDKEAAAATQGRKLAGARPDPDAPVRRAEAALEQARTALAATPTPVPPTRRPQANTTDPDSRVMKTPAGWLQGYNAQAVVSTDGVIVANGVTSCADDTNEFDPMVAAATTNLGAAGVRDEVGVVLADAGYFSDANATGEDPPRLIAPVKAAKLREQLRGHPPTTTSPPESASPREAMLHRLQSPEGAALYKRRGPTVEPVFGHIKEARGFRRFRRHGLDAVTGEWNFACAVHNTLKLIRHRQQAPPALA